EIALAGVGHKEGVALPVDGVEFTIKRGTAKCAPDQHGDTRDQIAGGAERTARGAQQRGGETADSATLKLYTEWPATGERAAIQPRLIRQPVQRKGEAHGAGQVR